MDLIRSVDRNRLPAGSRGRVVPRHVFDIRHSTATSLFLLFNGGDQIGTFRRVLSNGLCILLAMITLGYGVTALFYYFTQDRLVYKPEREMLFTPQNRGLAYDEVWFKTKDGISLEGWFIPAERSRGVMLYFHGNDGNMSHRINRMKYYHDLGLSIFMIDYRGYGRSKGAPSEEGMYRDAEAAWRYLTQYRGIAPKDIVIYGRSLGGGVAAYLAAHHHAGALVLESTFTSITDLGVELYPWLPVRQLSHFRYSVKEYLSKVDVPVLIIHSREDDLIPFSEGKQLLLAAREPRRFLEIRGGHDDGFLANVPQYTKALDSFLREFLS